MTDNTFVSKNYFKNGGDELVIGGKLTVESGATIEGVITPAAFQADSTATELAALVTAFNALLAALKAAGLMEASDSSAT